PPVSSLGSRSPASAEPVVPVPGMTVSDMEKQLIFHTLEQVGGNRTHAARLLGVSIRTLRNKLREYRENKNNPGQDNEESYCTTKEACSG
ncbi:MAG: helix-turn-helix domain-containing protein, partial [Candidatus Binatia bacterium]